MFGTGFFAPIYQRWFGNQAAEPAEVFRGHPDQRYGHLTYSQHGEDLVLVSLFEQVGIVRPSYLDIGAHHPLNCSNTALLYSRGSRGVNVDANPDLIEEFHRFRPDDTNVSVGVAAEPGTLTFYRIDALSGRNTFSREAAMRFVQEYPQFAITDELQIPVVTLDQLVEERCGARYPDFLSIDAEGLDYAILERASFEASHPRIISVEADSAAGARQDEIVRLLKSRGFDPLIKMGANILFLDRAVAELVRL